MNFSIVWLCAAFVLLWNHSPLTSLAFFNIFLLHNLWIKRKSKKSRQKS